MEGKVMEGTIFVPCHPIKGDRAWFHIGGHNISVAPKQNKKNRGGQGMV